MTNGIIVYRGPSQLTGAPIVAAITGFARASSNAKTGAMLQAWILRADMTPTAAIETGADEAICGSCPLRSGSNVGRACYVVWWLGPQQVYRALASYRDVSPFEIGARLAGHRVRLGAYGDPAAVPIDAWEPLIAAAAGWTGYTHQWRSCDPDYARFLMASVDTVDEQREASARGWRTFRLRRHGDQVGPNEVICPASDEAGHRTTCASCSLCQGAERQAKSIAILPHGQRTKWLDQVPA